MTDNRLLCVALFAMSFVVDVISFVTPHWYTIQNGPEDINGGLWKACANGIVCVATPVDAGGEFRAAQILITLGLISAILGAIAAVTLCVGVSSNKLRFLGITSLAAGVLTVVGAGVFDGLVELEGSWSLSLAYLAGVFYVLPVPTLYGRHLETCQILPS